MRELLLQPISCLDFCCQQLTASWGDNNVEMVGVKLDDILLGFLGGPIPGEVALSWSF